MIRTVFACLILFVILVAGWAINLVSYHEQTPNLAPLQTINFAAASIASQATNDVAERSKVFLSR